MRGRTRVAAATTTATDDVTTPATARPQPPARPRRADLLFAVMGGDGHVTLGNECDAVAPLALGAFDDLAPGAVVVPLCFDIAPEDVPGNRVGISRAREGTASMVVWELEPRAG